MYVYTDLLLTKNDFISDIEDIVKFTYAMKKSSCSDTNGVIVFPRLNIVLVAPNAYFVNIYRSWVYDRVKNARLSIVDSESMHDSFRIADVTIFVNTSPPPSTRNFRVDNYVVVLHVLGIDPIMSNMARHRFGRKSPGNDTKPLTAPRYGQHGSIFVPGNENNASLVSFKPPANFSRELTLVLFYHFVYSNIPRDRNKTWFVDKEETFNTLVGTWIGEAERVVQNETVDTNANIPFIDRMVIEGIVDGSAIRADIRHWMSMSSPRDSIPTLPNRGGKACVLESLTNLFGAESLAGIMLAERDSWSINGVYYMDYDSESMSSIIRRTER